MSYNLNHMVVAPRDAYNPREAQIRTNDNEDIRNLQVTVQNDLHHSPKKAYLNSDTYANFVSDRRNSTAEDLPKRNVNYSKTLASSKTLRTSIIQREFDEEIDTQQLQAQQNSTISRPENVIQIAANLDHVNSQSLAEMLMRIREARQLQQSSMLQSEQDFFKVRHHNRIQIDVDNRIEAPRRIKYNKTEDVLDPLVESAAYQYVAWKEWEEKNPSESNSRIIFSGTGNFHTKRPSSASAAVTKTRKSISFSDTTSTFEPTTPRGTKVNREQERVKYDEEIENLERNNVPPKKKSIFRQTSPKVENYESRTEEKPVPKKQPTTSFSEPEEKFDPHSTMEFTDDQLKQTKKRSKLAWNDGSSPETSDDEDTVRTHEKEDYEHLREKDENRYTEEDIQDEMEYPSAWVNDVSETQTSYTANSDFMKARVKTSTDLARKKKITIPTPFTFDQREAMRPRSIVKQKFQEYLTEIKAEEEGHLSHRFKANPIPSSTLEPRYEELVRRSNMSKKIHTTIDVKPFSFIERDKDRKQKKNFDRPKFKFKANPVPRTSREPLMHELKRGENRRKERIKTRAMDMYHSASLPPRMEMWKSMSNTLTDDQKEKKQKRHMSVDLTFRPKVNTEVPNFVELQHDFESKLAKRKMKKQTTQVKEFNFQKSKSTESMHKILLDMERDAQNRPENRWPFKGSRAKSPAATRTFEATDAPDVPSNRATDLRHQTIKQQQEEKENRKLAKEEEENRIKEKLNVAPHVPYGDLQSHYQKMHKKNMENSMRETRKQNEELKQTKQKRKEKLQDREFLFEKDITDNVRERVLGQVESTLRETGASYLYDSIKSTKT